jgi:hypothetical protein
MKKPFLRRLSVLRRRQPTSGGDERRQTNAAKAKAATCERILAPRSRGALVGTLTCEHSSSPLSDNRPQASLKAAQ